MELDGANFLTVPTRIAFISGNRHKGDDDDPDIDFAKTIFWIVNHDSVVTGKIRKHRDGHYEFVEDEGSRFHVDGSTKEAGELTSVEKRALIKEFELERRNLVAKWPSDFKSETEIIRPPEGIRLLPRPTDPGACCFDPAIEIAIINDSLRLVRQGRQYDPTPHYGAPAGIYTVTGRFANTSSHDMVPVLFVVSHLTDHVLLNAQGGPGGVGSTVFIDPLTCGNGGRLAPGRSFRAVFHIGFQKLEHFAFAVDVYGTIPEPLVSFFGGFDPTNVRARRKVPSRGPKTVSSPEPTKDR